MNILSECSGSGSGSGEIMSIVSPTPKHMFLDGVDLPGWGKADIGNGSMFAFMSPTFYDELPIHQ